MKSYCSIEDVLAVGIIFRGDVPDEGSTEETIYTPNTGTIPRDEVTLLISEASEMVRNSLDPCYNSDIIDSYDPDYPPIIVYLTATYTVILMLERYRALSHEQNKSVIESYNRSIRDYKEIIATGKLRDTDGSAVTRANGISVRYGSDNANYIATEKIKEVTQNGRFY